MSTSLSTLNIARIVTAVYAVSLVIAILWFRPGCVHLVVWASFEKEALLSDIAERYEQTRPSEDLRCVAIDVVRVASGDAEEALAHGAFGRAAPPSVWSPAANTWVRLLERHQIMAGAQPIVPVTGGVSILQSPLVIAMPEPMARALGWPNSEISWSEIFALAQDPRGWASRGHPEWSGFKLGKTSPLISTSGLHALIATQKTAGGSIDDAKVRAFMKGVESSVIRYRSTVSAFLKNLADADDRNEALQYVSAVAMEEKQVWDYNQGNPEFRSSGTRLAPKFKLVAVHPREGTLVADHPYVVLDAPWVDDAKRRAAARFLAYLKSDSVQREFQRNAFRGANGEIGPVIAASPELDPFRPIVQFSLPEPAALEQIQSSWMDYRKRARVLLVMDVSASMGDRLGTASASKLDLAKAATLSALERLAEDDDVALWSIAGTERRELIAMGPLRGQKALIRTEIERLTPEGTGKALYGTISSAVASVRQRFDRERINAVVVVTDGHNDDLSSSDLSGLIGRLRTQPEDRWVRVFTVAYGPGADRDALDKIALAADGVRYDADPSIIGRVILEVVSNF